LLSSDQRNFGGPSPGKAPEIGCLLEYLWTVPSFPTFDILMNTMPVKPQKRVI
jgi:hypothetical protein